MELIDAAILWVRDNPTLTALILLYVVLSAIPRPHPDKVLSPTAHYVWLVIDRLTIFSAERVPGRVKMIFQRSPEPQKEEAPKEGNTPS